MVGLGRGHRHLCVWRTSTFSAFAVDGRAGPWSHAGRLGGADGYSILLDLEAAVLPENFLAYELEGEPLPVLHGFPLRAVIPGRTGGVWVKWLIEIEVE